MSQLSNRQRAHLQAGFTALLWSFAFICIREVLRQLNAHGGSAYQAMMTMFLARIGIAALFFLPHVVLRWRLLPQFTRRDWLLVLALIVIGTYGYHLPLNYGAQTLPSGFVSLIIATSPIFAALLGWSILRESLSLSRVVGVAIGLLGVLLCLAGQGRLRLDDAAHFWRELAAPASVLFSALCGAAFAVIGRSVRSQWRPGLVLGLSLVAASVLALPLWRAENIRLLASLDWRGWLGLLYLAACCLYLASMLWYRSLAELDAVEVTIYLNGTTTLAMLWGALVFGERFSVLYLIGAAMVIGAIVVVNRRAPKSPQLPE